MAATGPNGPSIFPSTGLAARVRVPFDDNRGYVQLAATDARARTLGDRGGVDTSFKDGVLLVGELGHLLGPARLSLGTWSYTKKQEDLATVNLSGNPQMRKAWGVYGALEARIAGAGEGGRRLDAFLRGGTSEGRTSRFAYAACAGFLYGPLWAGRDESALLLGVRYARTSAPFCDAMRAAGETPGKREYGLELTYVDRLTRFLLVQPDVQVIVSPEGLANAPTAIVTTLRLMVEVPPLFR